jgi:hypothetical protein
MQGVAWRLACKPEEAEIVKPVPGHGRGKYAGMPWWLYLEMLEGEDPDDRAIREAHGIGYTDRVDGILCRNGCGLSYEYISARKVYKCEAAGNEEQP